MPSVTATPLHSNASRRREYSNVEVGDVSPPTSRIRLCEETVSSGAASGLTSCIVSPFPENPDVSMPQEHAHWKIPSPERAVSPASNVGRLAVSESRTYRKRHN